MSSRAYFDEISDEWDGMRQGFFSQSVREAALDALDVRPGARAADLGAGTGFITEGLLARGLSVIAVDQSVAMLGVIERKFADTNVECLLSDAERLQLADASVDYALANMYLHHVESPVAAISEAARILHAGGGLAITDLEQHSYTFLREEHHDRWLGFSYPQVRAWLETAGLEQISVGSIGSTCEATSSDAAAIQASISIFLATARKP